MKDYELTLLVHPDLEMNLEPATDKIKALIEKNGGEIVEERVDGKRRLAYQISKQDYAVYIYMDVKLPAEAVRKIDGGIKLTEEVIRHLLVSVDPRKVKYEAKQAARAEHAVEEKEA